MSAACADDVVTLLPRLRGIVCRRELPSNAVMDRDDMLQEAAIGALGAIRTYDPERGPFAVHAAIRARGAIIDAQRDLDPVARSWRHAQRAVTVARTRLVDELGRRPTADELAAALGLTRQELRDTEERCMPPTSLDAPMQFDGEAPLPVSETLAAAEPLPDELAEAHDDAKRLHAVIDKLPWRERFVIRASYFGDMTYPEIGEILGVTESRICQIKRSALKRLAPMLTPLRKSGCNQ